MAITAEVTFSTARAYTQTFLATCAIRVFGVASGILAARLLGPAGRGELEVIILLPTLAVALGGLGLPQAITYEVSKRPPEEARLGATGFWMSLALGAAQMFALWALLPRFLPLDKRHLLTPASWFVLYLPAVYVGTALVGVDQGRGRFRRYSVFQALPGALYVAAIVVLWLRGLVSPAGFAMAMLASAVVTAALRGWSMRDFILGPKTESNPRHRNSQTKVLKEGNNETTALAPVGGDGGRRTRSGEGEQPAFLTAEDGSHTQLLCPGPRSAGSATLEGPSRRTAYRLLRRGLSFHLPALAGLALGRADTLLLVRLAPAEAIGLYAVASAIAIGHMGTANPFVQVGFSAVAGEPDPVRAVRTMVRQFRLAQLAILASGAGAALLAPWIIRLAFGARFAAALPAAWFLVAATCFWGLAQVLEHGLRALARPRPGIFSNLFGLVVLVAAGIPACLRFGIAGMGCTMLLAHFANLAVLLSYCIRRFELPWRLYCGFTPEALHEVVGGFISRYLVSKVLAGSGQPWAAPFWGRCPWLPLGATRENPGRGSRHVPSPTLSGSGRR